MHVGWTFMSSSSDDSTSADLRRLKVTTVRLYPTFFRSVREVNRQLVCADNSALYFIPPQRDWKKNLYN